MGGSGTLVGLWVGLTLSVRFSDFQIEEGGFEDSGTGLDGVMRCLTPVLTLKEGLKQLQEEMVSSSSLGPDSRPRAFSCLYAV